MVVQQLAERGVLIIKMKRILMFLMLGMFLVSLASAESIGTFKQDECVDLIQTAVNSSYVKISSITYPDSKQVLDAEVTMEKLDNYYNYTFCNTTNLGTYQVSGYGDELGIDQIWAYTFEITPSGILSNVGILITFLFIVLILFTLSFYKIFNSNSKIEFIIFSISSYFMILIFIFMSWKISENYLYNMEWIVSLLYIIFLVVLILMFPFIIFLILYLFYNMFTERNMKEMIDMGYSPEEAKRYK